MSSIELDEHHLPEIQEEYFLFPYDMEKHNFYANQIHIVRLEADSPVKPDQLNDAQQKLGEVTTQMGRYSWTKFKDWEDALQYFVRFQDSVALGTRVTATPVHVPNRNYEELMKDYSGRAEIAGLEIVVIPHKLNWP